MNNGGLLYIEVPDASRFLKYIDAPFQQFSIEHINFFSNISLSNLMKLNGFKKVFCHQGVCEQSYKIKMPIVSCFFRKEEIQDTSIEVDKISTKSIQKYILKSKNIEKK